MHLDKNESSTTSFLPPKWESTILSYLLLPGLCAFFLFLLILIVVFRLIKTKSHKSPKYDSHRAGSYIEQSSNTSIYDVINDDVQPDMAESQRDFVVKAHPPCYLRETLPVPSRDFEQSQKLGLPANHQYLLSYDFNASRKDLANKEPPPPPQNPTTFHASSALRKDMRMVNSRNVSAISSLRNYADHNNTGFSNLYDGQPGSMVAESVKTGAVYLIDEPIYESLDRSWSKNQVRYQSGARLCHLTDCNGSEGREQSIYSVGLYDTTQRDNGYSYSKGVEVTPKQGNTGLEDYSDNPEEMNFSNHHLYETRDISKSSEFIAAEKNIPKTERQLEIRKNKNNTQPLMTGKIVCKLSVFVGSENEQMLPGSNVSHHYYEIDADRLPAQREGHTWLPDFDTSCLYLGPPNKATPLQRDNQRNNCDFPLKLEPVSFTSSLVHILTSTEQPACVTNSHTSDAKLNKGNRTSNPQPSANVASLSQNTAKLKKSQSFKESTRYKKKDGARKLSLGALSLEPYRTLSERTRQKSFDKLEASRILARLGPLPPTPVPSGHADERIIFPRNHLGSGQVTSSICALDLASTSEIADIQEIVTKEDPAILPDDKQTDIASKRCTHPENTGTEGGATPDFTDRRKSADERDGDINHYYILENNSGNDCPLDKNCTKPSREDGQHCSTGVKEMTNIRL